VDETFLQRMMLVFMDLASGYLLMKAVAVDRSYHTWYSGVNERLKTFGIGVLYLVSDRAKALIKLAQTGLGCLSIPDLFHLSHDLAKGYALAIFGRLRQAMQALAQAKQRLESLHNSQADRAQGRVQPLVADCERSVTIGRVFTAPGSSTLPTCRASYIPGALSTRPIRRHWRLNIICKPRSGARELLETNGLPVKGHLGQGPQAARWRRIPSISGGRRCARLGADGHDPEVDPVG
jgi:hypothetical protein